MATIDYKEKYEQALERARQFSEKPYLEDSAGIVEYIFPELAESEDERIKKAIEYAIGQSTHSDGTLINGISSEEALAWLEKQGEQKSEEVDNLHNYLYGEQESSEWSEEDKRIIDNLISQLGNLCSRKLIKEETKNKYVNWLKSLKDKVLPQPKQEWSKEDKKHYYGCLQYFGGTIKADSIFYEDYLWLKSLRPQKQDVMSVDEFRHIVGYLVQDIVANEHMAETEKQPTNFFVEKYYNKLSSQSHWKPSEGQLECLGYAIEKAEKDWSPLINNRIYLTLKALKEQLKKLREE